MAPGHKLANIPATWIPQDQGFGITKNCASVASRRERSTHGRLAARRASKPPPRHLRLSREARGLRRPAAAGCTHLLLPLELGQGAQW